MKKLIRLSISNTCSYFIRNITTPVIHKQLQVGKLASTTYFLLMDTENSLS
jgi:hypothetical protein